MGNIGSVVHGKDTRESVVVGWRLRNTELVPVYESQLMQSTNLGLCSKNLVELESVFGSLTQYTVLQLCCNSLSSIPSSIGGMSRLTHLSIGKNCLEELPETIGHLRSLQELDISHNNLVVLPSSMRHLNSLRVLRLNNNPNLSHIPRSLSSLEALSVLDISYTKITCIPEEVARNQNLRRLRLKGCPLIEYTLKKHKGHRDEDDHVVAIRAFLKQHQAKTSHITCETIEYNAPSLLELTGRKLVTRKNHNGLPEQLENFVDSFSLCSFCNAPFVAEYEVRYKFVPKPEYVLPVAYHLCSRHWDTEGDRLPALFATPTQVTCARLNAEPYQHTPPNTKGLIIYPPTKRHVPRRVPFPKSVLPKVMLPTAKSQSVVSEGIGVTDEIRRHHHYDTPRLPRRRSSAMYLE